MERPNTGEKVKTVEDIEREAIERFGEDAEFIYERDGVPLIMDLQEAFEISANHMLGLLNSGDDTLVKGVWEMMAGYKQGADEVKAAPEVFQELRAAGVKYIENWRKDQKK